MLSSRTWFLSLHPYIMASVSSPVGEPVPIQDVQALLDTEEDPGGPWDISGVEADEPEAEAKARRRCTRRLTVFV